MIIISLKNNSKYAQIIERKFAKKEKKKRKENNCSSPKNTPYCTAWKIGKK